MKLYMFRTVLCPSSGVYSLYTQYWYMSYRFEESFRAGPGWNWPVFGGICRKTPTTHMINIRETLQVISVKVQVITP